MEIIVCFDIGTVGTGYAFSSRREYEKDMLNVHLNEEWMSGHANLHTFKAPSTLLLQPDKTLHSFGYEAERKFTQLTESKQQEAWYCFKRFKGELKSKQFRKDTLVEAEGGKSMNGISVYSNVLKYLKNHCFDSLGESARYGPKDLLIRSTSIKYVITVPTKWDNASKECMKAAAKKAGVNPVMIFTESEAIGRYCRVVPLRANDQTAYYLQLPRSRHAIVNVGGTSSDIVIQEMSENGNITEFSKNLGNSSGGSRVDVDFMKFLQNLFGADFIESYAKKYKLDFMELLYEFEIRKRQFSLESDMAAQINLPQSFVKLCHSKHKQSMQFYIDDTDYVGRVQFYEDSLILDRTVMKDIFGPAVKSTMGYLANLSRDPETKQCDAIYFVGGFVDSPVVVGAAKYYYPTANIIMVDDSEHIVMKGGVLLGHNPDSHLPVSTKYTLGVGMAVPFNENNHSVDKLFISGGKRYCTDIFHAHVGIGKNVNIGDFSRTQRLVLNRSKQKVVSVPVYASIQRQPRYTTDDGCACLGKLVVKVPDDLDGKATVLIRMTLLGSSVLVEGVDETSGMFAQKCFALTSSNKS